MTNWTRVATVQTSGSRTGRTSPAEDDCFLTVPGAGRSAHAARSFRVEGAGIVVRTGEDVACHVDDIGQRGGLESGEVVLAGDRTGYDEHEREHGGHVLGLLSVGGVRHLGRQNH